MPLINLSTLPSKEIFPGFDGRFIHTDNLTVGYFDIKAGAMLREHSHMQEQITHVLQGRLQMTLDGETFIIEPGMVAVIPANASHAAIALTDCKALDVFYPQRDDYKNMMAS